MFLKYDKAKNAKQREKDVLCKHSQMAWKANFKAKLWESKGSRAPGTFKEEVKWELILRRVV